MTYSVKNSAKTTTYTVNDNTENSTSTSLVFIGKNYTGYGLALNENFLYLLENFSNTAGMYPANPVPGQLFWDNTNKYMHVYDGTAWKVIYGALASLTVNSAVSFNGIATTNGGQIKGYLTGAIGANTANTGAFTTVTAPTVYGGTTDSSTLTLESTSGAGTSDSIIFKTGSQATAMSIGTTGKVAIGSATSSSIDLYINANISGGTNAYGIYNAGIVQTDVTNAPRYFWTVAQTAASVSTSFLYHYGATQGTFGSGSTVTAQYGFLADGSLTGATNNFGFYGGIASGVNRWNLYMGGTASNYMAGALGIGTTSVGAAGTLTVNGNTALTTLTATGAITFNTTTNNQSYTTTGAGTITISSGTAGSINNMSIGATTASTGAFTTVTTTGNLYSGGNIIAASGTTSTSTTTGALVVSGGVGIAGNLYIGGNLSIAGNTTFINTQTITTTDTISAPVINANVVGNTGSSHYGTIATNAQPFITSVGTLTGLTISSAIVPSSNASINIGGTGSQYFNNVYAVNFLGTSTTAKYADLAEKYLPDADYEIGTVMMVGGSAEVTKHNGDRVRAIGVTSEYPAYKMNSDLDGGVYVALKGRVPVRVVGPVKKGQSLFGSAHGLAMATDDTTPTSFAIALESFDGNGIGSIEAVIL